VGEFWRDLKDKYPPSQINEFSLNKEWAGIGIITL